MKNTHKFDRGFAAAARRLEDRGQIAPRTLAGPGTPFKLTPGWVTIRVAMERPDGTRVDVERARALHADKPYAPILRYRGMARAVLCFEYDPAELERLLAKRAANQDRAAAPSPSRPPREPADTPAPAPSRPRRPGRGRR